MSSDSSDLSDPALLAAATANLAQPSSYQPSDALSALLNGTINERKITECDDIGTQIGGADREKLKQSDPKTYAKLKETACAGLKTKFKLMTVVDEKSAVADLQSIYSIQVRLRELRKELAQHNILDVFTVFSQYESSTRQGFTVAFPSTDIKHRHLLTDKYNITTFENVKKANAFYMLCGAKYQVENLKWSGEKVLASCEDALREKILESTALLPPEHHGGPVYFYLMMQLVATTSDHAMRCIIEKLKHLKLTDFPAENVLHAVTFLRGAINLLKNNNAIPHDLKSLLVSIMRGCTTPDFVSFVTSIETMVSLSLLPDTSIEFLLTTFEAKYTELLGANKWNATATSLSSGPSSFIANPQSSTNATSSPESICFNCGTVGHKVDSCPKPRNQADIDRFKAALQHLRGSAGGGTGGGSNVGGANSGSGTSTNGNNGNTNRHRNRPGGPADPLRVPPGKDAERTKTFPGLGERSWCGKCKVWTDHLSGGHPSIPAANAAGTETSAPSSPTPSSPPLSTTESESVGSPARVDADGFVTVTPRSYRSALVNQQLANISHF